MMSQSANLSLLCQACTCATSSSCVLQRFQHWFEDLDDLNAFLSDNGNLDLVSVEVTNDESNVFFSVQTREFADWTKYMVFVDSIDGSGADGNNNGWVTRFRNIGPTSRPSSNRPQTLLNEMDGRR